MKEKFHGWRRWVAKQQEMNISPDAPKTDPLAAASVAAFIGDIRLGWMREEQEQRGKQPPLPWEDA